MMLQNLKAAMKLALLYTPAGRTFAYRYSYSFSPRQLCFLASCIDRTASLSGAIAEVGCYRGHTTIFLNAHMSAEKIEKPYYALDTFAGFVPRQLDHEASERGKAPFRSVMRSAFADNSRTLFDRQIRWNGITRVRSFEGDAATFDYASFGPLSFALIDVDLYLPVRAALEKIVPFMQPGGIIVVDDCAPNQFYDGALQAYEEFVQQRGMQSNIVHGKLGVLEL